MQEDIHNSPLRYPGGKAALLKYLVNIIQINSPIKIYIEPFAGGAGAALGLLYNKHVERIILNDADEFIYCFWYAALNQTDDLVELIRQTPIDIKVWSRHRKLLSDKELSRKATKLEKGFAAFYLNRCNRSGILRPEVGPIGGIQQQSKWSIDARFKKDDLIQRIRKLALYKKKIHLYNLDAVFFLNKIEKLNVLLDQTLVYLDPPYFQRGPELYRSYYLKEQHISLQEYLESNLRFKWLLSYDDVPFINDLYKNSRKNGVLVNHFASKAKVGKELIIACDKCNLPE